MKDIKLLQNKIYELRGQKVMVDSDLSSFYDIEVRKINQAVKRNIERFPEDFMFQLSNEEWLNLKSHFVTSSQNFSWGGVRKLPHAFTEQGVAMLSSVLKSSKAIEVNIAIMRTFIKIRQSLIEYNKKPADELKMLKEMLLLHIENTENNLEEHGNKINSIIDVLNNIIEHPKTKRKIGFRLNDGE